MDTLFIFLDESGNFDFSKKGSRYWSLTALCTRNPIPGRSDLTGFLYDLAAAGDGQEYFHATEDKQSVRDRVFDLINKLPSGFEVHSVIAEKCKAHPTLYQRHVRKKEAIIIKKDVSQLYDRVGRVLLKYVFGRKRFENAKQIVIILSSIFDGPQHSVIQQTLRSYLSNHCDGKQFHIYFHAGKSDLNCQIADYCGWAIARKWEKNDRRSYDLISRHSFSEFDIFRNGNKRFY